MRALLAGAAWIFALASAASAQTRAGQQPARSGGLQVYLMTIGQGSAVWEKFGHNALWFRDPAAGIDVAYNWGIFDFAQPGFLRRFLTGDTRYWVEGYPGGLLIDAYRAADRTIVLQRLNLTPDQARAALEYSRWNAREENKYYRYDYFRDNCSTRVRDVIDRALGGALLASTSTRLTNRTYRSESVRLVHDLKLTQLGIYTALGEPADRALSAWEEMFIPMRMRDALLGVRIPRVGSQDAVPLVAEERTVYESTSQSERPNRPTLWVPYLIIGLFLASEFFAAGLVGQKVPIADKLFRIETLVWSVVTGILGTLVLLAWVGTRHVFWYRNENLLLLSPLSLWLAVLVALWMWNDRWLRPAAVLAAVIAMSGALAMIAKGVPGGAFDQDNLSLILLLLPSHFAIAFGLWRRATGGRLAVEDASAGVQQRQS